MKINFKELKKPWLGKYAGVTIIPYVFVYYGNKSKKQIAILKNHELIHAAQVTDEINKWCDKVGKIFGTPIGWINWYRNYVGCWLKNILTGYFSTKGMGANEAYMAIPAEKEAYANESNLDYLKTRKPFAVNAYK